MRFFEITYYENLIMAVSPQNEHLGNFLYWLLFDALMFGVVLIALRTGGVRLDFLGFRRTALRRAALLVVGFFLLSHFLIAIYVQFVTPEQEPASSQFGDGLSGFVMSMIIVAILGPIFEELAFRGFAYQHLGRFLGGRLGKPIGLSLAALASSGVWAYLHQGSDIFVPIFVSGLSYSALFSLTGSVWPPIAAHFLSNTLALVSEILGR